MSRLIWLQQPKLWPQLARASLFWVSLVALSVATGLSCQMVLGDFVKDAAFWDVRNLVSLGAEIIMLCAILFGACAPIGYSWFFLFGTVEVATKLIVAHIGRCPKVPPTHLLVQSSESQREVAAVKTTLVRLCAAIQARQPQRRSAGKGPILLFQQAPLLVAP